MLERRQLALVQTNAYLRLPVVLPSPLTMLGTKLEPTTVELKQEPHEDTSYIRVSKQGIISLGRIHTKRPLQIEIHY